MIFHSKTKYMLTTKIKRYRRFKSYPNRYWASHDFAYDWIYSIARYQLTGKIKNY